MRPRSNVLFMVVIAWCPLAIASHNQTVLATWMVAMITVSVLQIRSYLKGDPEAEKERRLAASRKKTAELEEDLGLKPLNLHELDPILLDKRHRDDGA